MGYLANFMVYTFAMVGVIVIALLVFKNSTSGGMIKKSKYLKLVDTMSLAPRKNLYIVSVGEEKFLIAGDVDKTTLISKLNTNSSEIVEIQNDLINKEINQSVDFRQTMDNIANKRKHSYMDRSNIGIKSIIMNSNNTAYTSVIRNLAEKMRG